MSQVQENIYSGIVRTVSKTRASVELIDAPKCTGCAISSACGNRPNGRIVDVATPVEYRIKPGDTVKVKCPPSSSSRATTLGIVIPCIILIATSLAMNALKISEQLTAASALGAVILYYLILLCMRKRLQKKLDWCIVTD